ncbi:FtsX-like permease family protein [Parafrankia elaeagni]|uniref:FtsX-like permease family protein n=1 Tax=Parafrankia elaeagni TaxID=222534 RepID=UPI0038995EDB
MGAVVGGWGAVIVLFSVASTVGLTVGQRDVEIGLLRTIGATGWQARRLVRAETLVVCLAAAALGALLAAAGGRALLATLVAGDVVSEVEFGGGAVSLPLTVAGILLVCLVAAAVAGRRATRGPASVTAADDLAADDLAGARPVRRWRVALALILIAYGVGMGVVTVTVSGNSDDPYDAMATSGSASLLVGVGLALLGPPLLPVGARLARPFLGGDGAGYLAGHTASRRAHLLGGVLGPVVVLTAGAVGTLMLVGTDGRTLVGEPPAGTETINLLNNVVVGMISLFATIMVVNSFAAVVAHRRVELRQLWLVGGTRAQIERSVVAEAALVAAVGVVLGLVGSLATIIPFGLARGEGVLPDGQLWLPPLIVAAVAALTVLTGTSAARCSATASPPSTRTPPVSSCWPVRCTGCGMGPAGATWPFCGSPRAVASPCRSSRRLC